MCMLTSLKVCYAITVMLLHWKVNAFCFVFIHAEPVKINTTTLYEDMLSVVCLVFHFILMLLFIVLYDYLFCNV